MFVNCLCECALSVRENEEKGGGQSFQKGSNKTELKEETRKKTNEGAGRESLRLNLLVIQQEGH